MHLHNSIISKIKKRDGRVVEFVPEKITDAIFKAAEAVGGSDKDDPHQQRYMALQAQLSSQISETQSLRAELKESREKCERLEKNLQK